MTVYQHLKENYYELPSVKGLDFSNEPQVNPIFKKLPLERGAFLSYDMRDGKMSIYDGSTCRKEDTVLSVDEAKEFLKDF